MNCIHRLVFNRTLGLVQVASEHARRCGRQAGGAGGARLSPLAAGLALALAAAAPAMAQEIIDGTEEVVDGYDPSGSGPGTRPSPWVIENDLVIGIGDSVALLDIRNGGIVSARAVLLGAGATDFGVLRLSGSGSMPGILETGLLEKGAGSAQIILNGAVLRATTSRQDFLRNFSNGDVIIGSNGAFIDSNGHDIGIGSSLEGDGRLTKTGEGVLTLDGAGTTLGGIRIEQGALAVAGGGTVSSSADIVAGYSADAAGTVVVSGSDSVLEGTGRLAAIRIGREGEGQLRIEDGAKVSGHYLTVVGDRESGSGTVWVTGPGSLLETTANAPTYIGDSGRGHLEIRDGGQVQSMFFASVGYREGGVGFASVSGQGSVWRVRSERDPGGNLYLGNSGHGTVVLADGGHLDLGDTVASHLTLAREVGASGRLVLGAVPGEAVAAAGTINARSIHFGSGDGTVVFNHAGDEYVLDLEFRSESSPVAGAGEDRIEHLAGHTRLTGPGTRFTGTTSVLGGTLAVDGRFGGTFEVRNGGTLSGSGTVGSTTVHDGGLLAPGGSIGSLTVDGDLTLTSGARLAFELGSPGPADDPAAGRSDTVDVTGDLVLDGTLDLLAAGDPEGSPGLGYYRLFTYGGTLQDNGLQIGQTPATDDPARYVLQAGGQRVDLFVAALGEDTLQHWQGGDGTWNAANPQWLNQGGQAPVAWAGNHAVFRHQPGDFSGGTVTVEGTQSFHGLQFVDNGYVLQGGGRLQVAADGAEVRVLEGVSAHIAASITGDGGLAKTGGGTLVLSGPNRYAGGTTLAGGILSVSADASLGATSGGLAFNGGTLHASAGFDSSRAVTLASGGGTIDIADGATFNLSGSLSGDGGLTKTGGGTLALSGSNDHGGGTTVAEGVLTGSAASLGSGGVEIGTGAEMILDQPADGSWNNALSGAGRLTKSGAGTLTYSGEGGSFSGTTRVTAGRLTVDGHLGGALEVHEAATLSGSGRIGRLDLHGQLDLAGPGARMDVMDDVLFNAGATWNLHAGASGQADLLSVTGAASIDPDSSLAILAGAGGNWAPRTTYTILSAGDGVEGTFGSVTSNLAFLVPSLDYGQDRITLTLDRNDIRFVDRALTRNQRAAAGGAESLGFGHPVYGAVVTQADDEARLAEAFDAISGEAHASARALMLEDVRAMDTAIARRFGGELAMGRLRADGAMLWLDGSGSQVRLGGDGNAARATTSGEGLVIGADMALGDRSRVGAAVGTRRVVQRMDGRASRAEGDGRQLALYADTDVGRLAVRGGVTRTDYDLDLARGIGLGSLDQRLEARQEAKATTWFAEAALDGEASPLPRPWLALAHTRLTSEAASETGGSAALDVAGGRHELGTATLGLRGSWDVSGSGQRVASLQADLGWRHAWGDLTPSAAAAFAGGDTFVVHAPALTRNAAVYRLQLGLAPTPRSRVAIGIGGLAGDRSRNFNGHLQWQVSF